MKKYAPKIKYTEESINLSKCSKEIEDDDDEERNKKEIVEDKEKEIIEDEKKEIVEDEEKEIMEDEEKEIMEDEEKEIVEDKEKEIIEDEKKEIMEDEKKEIIEDEEKEIIEDEEKEIIEDEKKEIFEDEEKEIGDKEKEIMMDEEKVIRDEDKEIMKDEEKEIIGDEKKAIVEDEEKEIEDEEKEIEKIERHIKEEEEIITKENKDITNDDEGIAKNKEKIGKGINDDSITSLKIKFSKNSVTTISLNKNSTINDLKIEISKEKDTDPEFISILLGSQKISNNTSINQLKLKESDILQASIVNDEDNYIRTTRSLTLYGQGDVNEYYSEYDEDEELQESVNDDKKGKIEPHVKIDENDSKKSDDAHEIYDEKIEEANKEELKIHNKESDIKQPNETKINEEEDSNEEDLFTSNKERIFRFLSVSFLNKLNKKRIDRGATSIVYKAYSDEYPEKIFALKVIDVDLIDQYNEDNDDNEDESEDNKNEDDAIKFDISKLRHFFIEYEILNKIDHPNIIKTYGFYPGDKDNAPAILLEYCPYNLKKIVKKMNNEERIEKIFELSDAMKKIHEVGIIHRDLKPENILIDENKKLKVSDFGICTLIKPDSETNRTEFAGTRRFMAPELRNENKFYDEKVDVYSFGVVVYWILTKGEYPKISFVEVANGKQAEIPDSISSFASELIKKCWSFDPKQRPSFSEIYNLLKTNKSRLIK